MAKSAAAPARGVPKPKGKPRTAVLRKAAFELGACDVMTFVATAKAAEARRFYEDVLGLRFVADEHFALVFDLNGTMLRMQRVKEFTPHPFTALGWQVRDIRAAARTLTERGVEFLKLGGGFPQDELGVWTAPGGAKVAWFKDPDGNTLSLTELSESD